MTIIKGFKDETGYELWENGRLAHVLARSGGVRLLGEREVHADLHPVNVLKNYKN